jgi:hypothetical protein
MMGCLFIVRIVALGLSLCSIGPSDSSSDPVIVSAAFICIELIIRFYI